MTAKQVYEQWKHLIGIKNYAGTKLTTTMLRTWSRDPHRLLECNYDGETCLPESKICHKCKEYKGLAPFIPEWSDWQ